MYFDKLESSKLTKNPLVSVWLLTYNHRNYIDFAVKSALNQKTDFNYEIILGDDFSDDGTREIVKMFYCRYPDKIRLILSTKNLWKDYGPLLSLELYKECRGKYIATLEGDDFWSDNLKLQKQVDFLERNPKYSLCSTDYNILKNKFVCVGNIGHNFKNSSFIDFELKDILNKYLLKTCSVLFRKKYLPNIYFQNPGNDVVIFSHILSNRKGAILSDITSTYRIHSGGIYSSKPEIVKVLQDYDELKILKFSKFNIKGLNQKFHLLKNKVKDLVDINLSNSNNQDFYNLNIYLKNKNFFFYESLHYNLAKAVLKYKFNSIHIYKHASIKHFLADIPNFFKSPKLLNMYCIFIFILFWSLYVIKFPFSKDEN